MAKADKIKGKSSGIKPIKKVVLPEVTVTATRIRKPVDQKVKLYPKGEASKKSVDSLKRLDLAKLLVSQSRLKDKFLPMVQLQVMLSRKS